MGPSMVSCDDRVCMHCSGCAAVCPEGAITVHEARVEIDEGMCIKCGNCVMVCPVGALSMDGTKPKGKGK